MTLPKELEEEFEKIAPYESSCCGCNLTSDMDNLKSFLAKTFAAGYKDGVKAGLMEARDLLPKIEDSGCQGYDDRPHYCSNCCQSGGEIISTYRTEFLSRLEKRLNDGVQE